MNIDFQYQCTHCISGVTLYDMISETYHKVSYQSSQEGVSPVMIKARMNAWIYSVYSVSYRWYEVLRPYDPDGSHCLPLIGPDLTALASYWFGIRYSLATLEMRWHSQL